MGAERQIHHDAAMPGREKRHHLAPEIGVGELTLAALRNGIANAISSGAMAERPVDMLAHMILGALSEATMAIARAPQPKKVLKEALREFDLLIEGVTQRSR
jgi:hypothetical protein